MASTLVKKENNTVEFKFEISVDAFEVAMDKAFKKNAKYFNIPGFRKGKAPRKMVEKMYGEGVLYEDAINFAFPEAYDSAIDELQLEPVSNPELDIDTLEKGQPVVLIAKVTVKPEVTLGEYKGIEIKKPEYNVTAKDVNAEISRMVTVEDRAVKKGDIANIDFEGFKDGVAFDGGKGEKFDLTIGSGQFIPGFEDQLIGAKIGEEKEIEVTFPEDYQAEELKGAKATFKVKINGITVKELPALDDEFAKDNDFDTFDALKADVKAKLKKAADDRAKAEIENEVITVAAKNITADIPDCMIDTQLDAIVRDYDMRLAQQGLNVEKYLQIMGMTMEQFKEGFKDRAKEQVRVSLMLEAVAKAEKVEVTEKEIEDEIANIAEMYIWVWKSVQRENMYLVC